MSSTRYSFGRRFRLLPSENCSSSVSCWRSCCSAIFSGPSASPRWRRPVGTPGCWFLGARVALAVLAISQVANLFGYYKLMLYLAAACIYSVFIALAVYRPAGLHGAVPGRPRYSFCRAMPLVRLHRPTLACWVPRVVPWAGILIWVGDAGFAEPPHIVHGRGSVSRFRIVGASGNLR